MTPNSPAVETSPCPKTWAQKRLTLTRAVSGCSGRVSHRASPRRLAGAPLGRGGRIAGTAAPTLSPSWSYWPRMRIRAKGFPFFSLAMRVTFERDFTASNSSTSASRAISEAPCVRVDEGEVVVAQGLQQFFGPLGRGLGEGRFDRDATGQHLHLRRRQDPSIETDVVDRSAARSLAGAASVQAQRCLRPNGPAQRIHLLEDALGLRRRSRSSTPLAFREPS